MKFLIVFVFTISVLFSVGWSADWMPILSGEVTNPSIEVIACDVNQTILEFTLPGFYYKEIEIGNQKYTRISIPSWYLTSYVGLPDLPAVELMFIAKNGTEIQVDIEPVSTLEFTFDYRIAPVQPGQLDLPVTEDQMFEENIPEIYTENDVYEMKQIITFPAQKYSHIPVASVYYSPFVYDLETNTLKVVTEARIVISTQAAVEATFTVNKSVDEWFSQDLLNYIAYEQGIDVIEDRCLIIFNASNWDYWDVLQEYHDFYESKGITMYWELPYDPTAEDIHNICDYYYLNQDVNYILLVGGHDQIPSTRFYAFNEFHWSDQLYANVVSGWYRPDMAIGRIPGDPATVATTLDLIFDGYINFWSPLFPPAGCRPNPNQINLVADDDHDIYQETCETIRTTSYTEADLSFYTFYEPGVNISELIDNINTRTSVTLYRGHGNWCAWIDPLFWVWDIYDLWNNHRGLVFNIACSCGHYVGSGTCMGEGWIWAEDGGASANIAATCGTYRPYNDQLAIALFNRIYSEGDYRIGWALKRALWEVATGGSSPSEREKSEKTRYSYILFGDPLMMIWTEENANLHWDPSVQPSEWNADEVASLTVSSPDIYSLITPNPTQGNCIINIQSQEQGNVVVSIFDISGRMHYRAQAVHGIETDTIIPLETKNLSAGMYFVRVEIGDSSISQKLVVTR